MGQNIVKLNMRGKDGDLKLIKSSFKNMSKAKIVKISLSRIKNHGAGP